jgi:UDP-galactopyranose mutase
MAADNGFTCEIIDIREHVGGNCYSYKDEVSGVEVHKYGPHIFHTSSAEVWNFVKRFTEFNNYVHRVKAVTQGQVFSLPINLLTINSIFKKNYSPGEAERFIKSIRKKIPSITNFEEYVLSSLGEELYEAFFKYYTLKQWGIDPKEIPVSVAKRLPVRFNFDDNYYQDVYQGIPTEGYTDIFHRMLDHADIKIRLGTNFDEYKSSWRQHYKRLVFTGSLDEYYVYCLGALPYRTVRFKELRGKEIQGTAQINYTDMSVPYTRIHEHKWFTMEKKFEYSIAFEEFADDTTSKNEPYYPVRYTSSDDLYKKYRIMAETEKDVIFVGRLAEFKYYDMHQVIASAIAKFKNSMHAK